MSSAHVQSIAALGNFHSALMRFKADALTVLREVEMEIGRTQAWLQERLTYWQQELKRRKRRLEEAIARLRACEALAIAAMASGGNAASDCSPLQAEVARARRAAQEAEEEIRTVQMHMKSVEEAVQSYRQAARQLNGTLEGDLLKGAALISNSQAILQSYASGSVGIASNYHSSLDIPPTISSSNIGSSVGTGEAKFDHVNVNCPKCGGSGTEDIECNPCGGTGHQFNGEKCPHCRGLGKQAIKCWDCRGRGFI